MPPDRGNRFKLSGELFKSKNPKISSYRFLAVIARLDPQYSKSQLGMCKNEAAETVSLNHQKFEKLSLDPLTSLENQPLLDIHLYLPRTRGL